MGISRSSPVCVSRRRSAADACPRRGRRRPALFHSMRTLGCERARFCMMRLPRSSSRRWMSTTSRGELGQEERLLERAVPATHDRDPPVPEEEAVARGAGRDAAATQPRLVGQVQPDGRGAGGDDDGVGACSGCRRPSPRRVATEKSTASTSTSTRRAPKRSAWARMSAISSGPVDAVREARVVLHLRRDHQLAAGDEAGDDERREVRARRVDGGRQAGRSAADDEDAGMRAVAARHDRRLRLLRRLERDGRDRGDGRGRLVRRDAHPSTPVGYSPRHRRYPIRRPSIRASPAARSGEVEVRARARAGPAAQLRDDVAADELQLGEVVHARGR